MSFTFKINNLKNDQWRKVTFLQKGNAKGLYKTKLRKQCFSFNLYFEFIFKDLT